MNTLKFCVVLLITLSIIGCDSSSSDKSDKEPLSDWESHNIHSYTFEYMTNGFSPRSGEKWEIQVANDEVVYTNFLGNGNPREELNIEMAPTINSLLEKITRCEEKESCQIKVQEYDEKYSYPVKYSEQIISESIGFEVSGFVAQ